MERVVLDPKLSALEVAEKGADGRPVTQEDGYVYIGLHPDMDPDGSMARLPIVAGQDTQNYFPDENITLPNTD